MQKHMTSREKEGPGSEKLLSRFPEAVHCNDRTDDVELRHVVISGFDPRIDSSSYRDSRDGDVWKKRSILEDQGLDSWRNISISGHTFVRVVKAILVLLYVAYSVYSLYRTWGTENATPSVGAVVYLAMEVVPYRPRNLMSLVGLTLLFLTSFILSNNPRKVNWHTVFWGIALQFYMAIFVLRTQVGYSIFSWMGDRITDFISYTDAGSRFIFGQNYAEHYFAFKQLPVLLFINAFIAVAYHFGLVQAFVAYFGKFLAYCLGTTAVESVNTAANIFLTLLEAPLVIKPFLSHVTESELFAIMAGGFASIAGITMAVVISFGIPANHILTASVMSAPAALAIAKLMCPETSRSATNTQDAYKIDTGAPKGLLEAVCKAALDGVTIAVMAAANLLVFVAALQLADETLEWFGEQAGVQHLTVRRLLSYVFYPMMYLYGVDPQDLLTLGRLLGVKIFASTFLAYKQAAELVKNSDQLADYVTQTNGTWHYVRDDVILDAWNQTLVGGVLTERSIVMSTYILCGLYEIAALAVCMGTLSALAPSRTKDIAKHVTRAYVAGNIACYMTGCVAGAYLYK
ncbi:hypothetical protein BaRGS_00005675 [Batillaria attramentaria]|uniref:Sodium/nucleoside cotransporter n=1 Tax=Batillaria attramentaria TaxID=370345 RepID=A0ABD0LVJ7_9CAEN